MKPLHTGRFKYRQTVALFISSACFNAWAAYDCTTTSPSLNVTYTANTTLDRTGQLTITCTRLSTDAASNTYSVGFDTGEPPNGRQYSRIGGSGAGTDLLAYNLYRESSYASTWNNTSRRVTGNINFGTTLLTSFTLPFYLRITPQTGRPSGTYDDTAVGVRFRIPATGGIVGQDNITLYAVINPTCSITTPPGQITLNYTSLSATAVTGLTSYSVTCTNQTPYTMALDATSGVLLGLNYTLSLSAASVNATGAAQLFNINANVPANQSGTCNTGVCTATQQRTLTITY